MKLSDYQNEEALDVLADILEPASALIGDKGVEAALRNGKPSLLVAKVAIKNQKQAVVELVSYLHRKKPGEYKFTMISLISDLLDILNDPEITQLFTSPDTVTSSGSAMESIEAKDA